MALLTSVFFSFSVWPLLTIHCRCRALLLYLNTLKDTYTHTIGRTPLDEGSARRRHLYLTTHNTHKRQHIYASGGIRTRNPSKRAAADPRLRPRGHRDRPLLHFTLLIPLCIYIWTITITVIFFVIVIWSCYSSTGSTATFIYSTTCYRYVLRWIGIK